MFRRVVPVLALAALAVALPGCGSGDESTGASGSQPGDRVRRGGPMMLQLTAAQRACVERRGVALPQAPPAGQRPPRGAPPRDGAPSGRPRRLLRRGPGGADVAKLRAALTACGVQLPERPQGPPPQATTTPQAPS